jgi:hypothetical protein
MENEMIRALSVITLTQAEKDAIDALIDRMDYKCGDDGWIPSFKDVEEKLIGRYYEKVRELRALMSVPPDKRKINECREEIKRMWLFMYWIVETCPDMEPAAYERLYTFVDSKMQIE